MALFFNKKKQVSTKKNKYLEDQNAVFETKGEVKKETRTDSYDEYIMREKDYSNVPKYKAFDEKKVDVVIDKEALDFQDLNPNVTTINVEKKNLHEDLQEIMNGANKKEKTGELNRKILKIGTAQLIA